MKSILALGLFVSLAASAQSKSKYNDYEKKVEGATGLYLVSLMSRDLVAMIANCGLDSSKIVVDSISTVVDKSGNKTPEQVGQIAKEELGNATTQALAMTKNSKCKDYIEQTRISFIRGAINTLEDVSYLVDLAKKSLEKK